MNVEEALQIQDQYREILARWRGTRRIIRKLPKTSFFLFGMGPREQLIYQLRSDFPTIGQRKAVRASHLARRGNVPFPAESCRKRE